MKKLLVALSAIWMSATAPAQAGQVAVVELFTSQGCSSCPPADKIFNELTKRDDVVALSYHVDYWDYLGWVDEFADPSFTNVQRAYARAAGERTIYTPQVVIGGQDHVIGSRPMKIANTLRKHLNSPTLVSITLNRSGDTVRVQAEAERRIPTDLVVRVVTLVPKATVKIRRGENAGRTLTYTNIVQSRESLGSWDGRSAFRATAKVDADTPVIVLVQQSDAGPILGAAQLR